MASTPPFARRDRPWLLPSNRSKLRNLVSISLRNLSLDTPSGGRRRGKTIDDDALPQTLLSPAKMLALRESKALEHSRSSSDLRSVAEDQDAGIAVVDDERTNGSPVKAKGKGRLHGQTPPRPMLGRMRRRSTLEWANATPQKRQERLEKVTVERMADVFFSLHVAGIDEPIYVSETVERTMNPTFRNIDFSACGPGIMRLDHLTLKTWAKTKRMEGWRQLMELSLGLFNLQYLAKSLDDMKSSLPQNAVLFHMTDGIYTCFTSLADYVPPPAAALARMGSHRVLTTSSFDALLRLSKLDDSIQDALATRNKLASSLEDLLESNREPLEDQDRVHEAEDRVKTIDYARKTVEKQLDKARKQASERRASLRTRRKLMASDLERRKLERDRKANAQSETPALRDEQAVKHKAIASQRRRICSDLQTIYPVLPIPKQSLAFTIRDLRLPNADDLETEPPDLVAAAFGHVAHIVLLLSFYLGQPLPYPVNPRGSTSTISDPISLLKTTASMTQSYRDERTLRTYPLFSRGVPRFRHEYGIFLLDTNVRLLLESAYGVRVIDVRQTLPNLKYLLYVATAGEGELPTRKAGGVRGLVRGRGMGKNERTGSDASTSSALSGLLWHSGGGGDAKANGKVGKSPAAGAVESLRRNMGGR